MKKIILTAVISLLTTQAYSATRSWADAATGLALQAGQFTGIVAFEGNAANQVQQLATKGYVIDPKTGTEIHLSAGLHALIASLLTHATLTQSSFTILSLARAEGPHGLTGIGRAIDISTFDNHIVRIHQHGEVIQALEGLINVLPANTYTIGLPRTAYRSDETPSKCAKPDHQQCDRDTYSARVSADVFANPARYDQFIPARYNESFPARRPLSEPLADLDFVSNEAYASVLRSAAQAAIDERGVSFSGFMADALDHIHVAVDTNTQTLP